MTYREAIADLRSELSRTRHNMLLLTPEPFRTELLECLACRDSVALSAWENRLVDQVIEVARLSQKRIESFGYELLPRSACPLCGREGSGSKRHPGFAVPEGLLRHLKGSYGMARCFVVEAAVSLAEDSVQRHREELSDDT